MRALDDAVSAGKVLYVGVSDTPAWVVSRANTLADWHGWAPFIGLQLPYSLVQRDIERELLPMADVLGLSVAAWSPLAGGVLSGKFTRAGRDGPTRVDPKDISDRDLRVARVDAVADELGLSSSQLALAWTMARRPSLHPIVGARHLDQLMDNMAATELELPEVVMGRLDAMSTFERGFPMDMIESTRAFVYGPVLERMDTR